LELGSNKNSLRIEENDVRNSISLTNSINEMVQSIGSSSCKCDCDRSSTTLESITTQFIENQNQNQTNYEIEINSNNLRSNTESKSTNPIIFVITPTYTRATQMPDMTRLSQTLRLVKDLFWIVVEDSHVLSM
jgi:UDP-N-acetyl-D-mannosaminuronate dehydrogenase